jgi:hypothetical protein
MPRASSASPDGAYPALVFEAVESVQSFLYGYQVVDLGEPDAAAEVAQGALDLALRLAIMGGPDLRGEDGPLAPVLL